MTCAEVCSVVDGGVEELRCFARVGLAVGGDEGEKGVELGGGGGGEIFGGKVFGGAVCRVGGVQVVRVRGAVGRGGGDCLIGVFRARNVDSYKVLAKMIQPHRGLLNAAGQQLQLFDKFFGV